MRREDLPTLPEELLPYERKNIDDVCNCLAWQIGAEKRRGTFGTYEEILSFLTFLIECGLPDEQIQSAFQLIFPDDYDSRLTEYYAERTKMRLDTGAPVIGAGSFFKRVKELDLGNIVRFARELQAVTEAAPAPQRVSYGSYGSYGSHNNDLDIIHPVPFPFGAFPEPFQELIYTYSKGLQIEPELVALMMMGVLSGAIGNTVRVSVKEGWATTLFLWIAYIAESGYGKSPAQNAILHPVRRLQAKDTDRYNAKLKAYDEAVRKARRDDSAQIPEKPRATQKLVSDTTVEALADVFEHDGRGVICDKDELSGFVLSFNQYRQRGGDDRQKWLSLFNCESLKIDRKSGPRFIKNTGIAIIGGIQPKILPKVFNEGAFDDGLLPRFLLYDAKTQTLRFNRQGISQGAREDWQTLVRGCYELPCEYDDDGFIRPKVLILDSKALDLWEDFFNECGQMAPFLSEKARVFIPKLTSYYSLKFAGILHVLRCLVSKAEMPQLIHKDVVEGAIGLTRSFMWQTVNALKLYHRVEKQFTEYQERLIRTMYLLRNEVKNGKLQVERIVQTFNEGLLEKLQFTSEKVARMLAEFGLTTKRSTGNYSYLIWEAQKIERLFPEASLTTLTTSPRNSTQGVDEVNEVKVDDTKQFDPQSGNDQDGWERGD